MRYDKTNETPARIAVHPDDLDCASRRLVGETGLNHRMIGKAVELASNERFSFR